MDDGAIKTLFLPFETGDVGTGGVDAHWLFLNANVPPQGSPLGRSQIAAVQGFRPYFRALETQVYKITPEVPEGKFDGAIILVSRHRGENRRFLNQAISRVRPGGKIIIAGSKTDGIASVAKEIGEHVELLGNLSKHHAKSFWFNAKPSIRFEQAEVQAVDGRFETASGMFSSDHVDPGSAFLIESLPADMKGRVADFCAGWGYLAVEASTRFAAVKSVALYEADHSSLEAAKSNMAKLAPDMIATFHWQDLIAEKASGDYDTIIMNPPFHKGRAADPGIGTAIISNAHNALHRGGKLYLVANRNLPYEAALETGFFKSGELARNNYYKVLWATK